MRPSPGWSPNGAVATAATAARAGSFVGVHSVNGPMARSVGDLALLMDAMCVSNSFRFGDSRSMGWGFDTPSPSMQAHANPFAAATRVALSAGIGAPRVAWTPDFGLCANCVDGDVVEICRRAAERFAATAGCTLVDACPALSVDISNSACAQKK